MHDVSTRSTPKNIPELFIHSSDVQHAFLNRFFLQHAFLNTFLHSIRVEDNIFVQKSRLSLSLCLVRDYGTFYTPIGVSSRKEHLKKIHKLLLTVLEIEDYYVDARSVILNLNTSNYYTLKLSTSHVAVYLLYPFQFP